MLLASCKAILKEAGYVGAGTVEFLVGMDGTISLPRGQHHPPGRAPRHRGSRQASTSSARCSASPTARNWATATPPCAATPSSSASTAKTPAGVSSRPPGTVSTFAPPSGPGVRLDAGVPGLRQRDRPGLGLPLAKLIVTGATREQALQRAARALEEFEIGGMATALPFHRAVVKDPAFAPELTGSSRPVHGPHPLDRTEFVNGIPAFTDPAEVAEAEDEAGRESVVVEVGGKRLEVSLPSSLGMSLARTGLAAGASPSAAQPGGRPGRLR